MILLKWFICICMLRVLLSVGLVVVVWWLWLFGCFLVGVVWVFYGGLVVCCD